MRISTFKKFLDSLDESDLREELLKLYKKVDEVKLYYKMDLGSDKERQKVFAQAKKEIAKKFVTKSYRKPRRPRIQKLNSILRETEKTTELDYEMIDIYLHTAECGVKFMREYDFYSTPLENVICINYNKSVELMKLNRMENEFEERCKKIAAKLKYHYTLKSRLTPL